MIDALAGQVLQQSGQLQAALRRYEIALKRHPDHLQLVYDYPRTLILARRYAAATAFAEAQLVQWRGDANLHQIVAEANAALNRQTKSHYHQGEYYAAIGNIPGAMEQFKLSLLSDDGDYRDQIVAEARLRELLARQRDAGAEGAHRRSMAQEAPRDTPLPEFTRR